MSSTQTQNQLQEQVRGACIEKNAFSYAFTRLLLDRLKELYNQNEALVGGTARYTPAAETLVSFITDQVRWENPVCAGEEELKLLIPHTERFLSLFEEAE